MGRGPNRGMGKQIGGEKNKHDGLQFQCMEFDIRVIKQRISFTIRDVCSASSAKNRKDKTIANAFELTVIALSWLTGFNTGFFMFVGLCGQWTPELTVTEQLFSLKKCLHQPEHPE
jgi:hypothetical protein